MGIGDSRLQIAAMNEFTAYLGETRSKRVQRRCSVIKECWQCALLNAL
jgi:hypothetical protein